MAEIKVRAERQTGDEIAQQIAEIVLDAEVRLGEMLEGLADPTASRAGRRQNPDTSLAGSVGTLPEGITKKQSHKARRL